MDSPSARRVHVIAGILVVLVLPLVSWLDGSGQLAWTMFSRTGTYRLVIRADGAPVNPTELAAAAVPGPTAMALAGSDHPKHHDVWRATTRRHLDDLAALACAVRRATTVTIRLEERVRSSSPLRVSERTVRCGG